MRAGRCCWMQRTQGCRRCLPHVAAAAAASLRPPRPTPAPPPPLPPPTLPPPPPQWLNVGIFRAIGHAGVYYGFKLGHTIPWVDGFPFNVVRAWEGPRLEFGLCACFLLLAG